MAVALALLTSITYGVGNYLGPRLARDAPYLLVLVVGQACSLVLSAALVAASAPAAPGMVAVGWALLSGAGNALGLILFFRAAQIGPLSIVITVSTIGVAVPVVAGLAGGESVTMIQAAGIALAVAGTMLVARRPALAAGAGPDPAHADRRRAVLLSLFAAAAFGVFLASLKPASQDGAAWAVLVSRAGVVALLVVVAVHARAFAARLPAAQLAKLAVPGVLLFAGTLSFAAATREGDLAIVSVLGSLFTVVTVALAVILDGERLPRIGWAGVACALAGVVLLAART